MITTIYTCDECKEVQPNEKELNTLLLGVNKGSAYANWSVSSSLLAKYHLCTKCLENLRNRRSDQSYIKDIADSALKDKS